MNKGTRSEVPLNVRNSSQRSDQRSNGALFFSRRGPLGLKSGFASELSSSLTARQETCPPVTRYPRMRNKTATIAIPNGIDWKALGYLTSIVSVFFLGCAAWLKESPPWWYHPALLTGMATSILGMGFRYKSHLDERREFSKAEKKAETRPQRSSSRSRTPSRA